MMSRKEMEEMARRGIVPSCRNCAGMRGMGCYSIVAGTYFAREPKILDAEETGGKCPVYRWAAFEHSAASAG